MTYTEFCKRTPSFSKNGKLLGWICQECNTLINEPNILCDDCKRKLNNNEAIILLNEED